MLLVLSIQSCEILIRARRQTGLALRGGSETGTIDMVHYLMLKIKLGGDANRFGDYLCVNCANVPCICGHNQFTNTKPTRPITQTSKSTEDKREKNGKLYQSRRRPARFSSTKSCAAMLIYKQT